MRLGAGGAGSGDEFGGGEEALPEGHKLFALSADGVQGAAKEGDFRHGSVSRGVNDSEKLIHFGGITESGMTCFDGLDLSLD